MTIVAVTTTIDEPRIGRILNAIDSAPSLVLDERGKIVSVTASETTLNGFPVAELHGKNLASLFSHSDRRKGLPGRWLAEAAANGSSETECWQVCKTAPPYRARLSLNAVRNGKGSLTGFIATIRDEERKERTIDLLHQTNTILMQAQKMEAIGQLTGGIAHDFNNLLTVIINSLEFLSRKDYGQRETRHIETARRAASHGAKLTRQLLTFSRQQPLCPKIHNPNELIAGFESVLRRACGEAIKFRLNLGRSVRAASLDATQFETALLNLVVNARDAMPEGGMLTIATREITVDPVIQQRVRENGCASSLCPVNGRKRAQIRAHPALAASIQSGCAMMDLDGGTHIMVSVRDTGAGMSAQTMQRVFEPFFTTKEPGKGTGLGLSQVYGFVVQSNGHIAIDSLPGHGTSVRFYLPAVQPAEGETVAAESDASPLACQGVVLIVEDESAVRGVAADLFESLGYSTLLATDGPAALRIIETNGEIDLLFTDLMMPNGLSGLELARKAKSLHPSMKVMFTSGYPLASLPAEVHDIAFVAKPFRKDEIVRRLQAL